MFVRECAALSDSSWQTMPNNGEKVAQIRALHVQPGADMSLRDEKSFVLQNSREKGLISGESLASIF